MNPWCLRSQANKHLPVRSLRLYRAVNVVSKWGVCVFESVCVCVCVYVCVRVCGAV